MSVLPAVGLLEACDDERLLGVDLWPTQRELLAAVEQHRLSVWALGRRGGKSTALACLGLHACTLRPELRRYLRPGERGYAVVVATKLAQGRLVVRAAREIVERSPLLGPLLESATEDELVFSTGMVLTGFPCSSRGGRGWPVATLMLDEAAHFIDSEGNAAALPVWRALSPSVAQFGADGRIVVSSTPWGQDGLFAELHARAGSDELEDAVAFRVSSEVANPTLDRALIARERAADPELARSEFDAEFVAGGASFFDPENVAAAMSLPGELRPDDADGWVAGLDPAFANDTFAVVLVGRDRHDRRRLLVGAVRGWLPPKRKAGSLDEARKVEDVVLAEVAQLIRAFAAKAVTDQYRSAGVAERLRRLGVSVRVQPVTAPVKDASFGFLRGRVNDGSLELFEHAELGRELRAVRTRFAAGRSSVVLPRVGRGHCDHAAALALAVFEHDRYGLGRGSGGLAGVGVVGASVGSSRAERFGERHRPAAGLGSLDAEQERAPLGYGSTL